MIEDLLAIEADEKAIRRLHLIAGTGYGVIFAILFAFFTWGMDGWHLYVSHADMAWVKLGLGFPIAVLVFALVGFLSALSSSSIIAIVLWAITLFFMSIVSGHLPFDGISLYTWMVDNRLWGEAILPFGYSAEVRTTLAVIVNIFIGGAAGFIETVAVNWAWDRSKNGKRMSLASWFVLLVSLPLALLAAVIVNGLIYQPLRLPQEVVHQTIQAGLVGNVGEAKVMESSYRSIKPFVNNLSNSYETYFVGFSTETGTWFSAYVDVRFDNGFVMRCVTLGEKLAYCGDFSENMSEWLNEVIVGAREKTQPWQEKKMRTLAVPPNTKSWLDEHSGMMDLNYHWVWNEQYSGWFFVTVDFLNNYWMECRFHGTVPIVLDRCAGLGD